MVILGFFFYLGFLLQPFTNHRIAGEGGGNSFNSSLPLSPASQTLSHYPGDYCIKLTSPHRQQPDLHRAPLISERKSLTTKQRLVSQWMTSKIRLKRAFTEKKTSIFFYHFRSSRPEVCCKKMFLEIFQNSLENTSATVFF